MPTTRPQKKNVSMQQLLAALLDEQKVFPPAYLHQFSDLEGKDLEAVRSIWPQVSPSRRYTLLEDLEDLAESDTVVSFDNFARMALDDPDPRVRAVAIRLLWEAEDPRLIPVFLRMVEKDPDPGVRAAAATALGLFIYLGELEELPEDKLHQVEDRLLQVTQGQDEELIRRRALESLGFSGRPEVPDLIRAAYRSENNDWKSTALFAMGRSADTAWGPDVIRALRHPKANVQLEAVRAAGELELELSRRILLDLLEEEAQDSEIRAAVIWSLSQIGGEEVRETLETLLDETEDEEEAEVLENALDNLSFTEDTSLFGLFDFDQLGQANQEIEDLEAYSRGYDDIENEIDLKESDHEQPDNTSSSTEDGGEKARRRHKKPKK